MNHLLTALTPTTKLPGYNPVVPVEAALSITADDLLTPIRDLFEIDSVAAIILDASHQPVFVNARAADLLAIPAAATRGDLRAIPHEQFQEVLNLLPLASPLGPLEMTFTHRRPLAIVALRARSIRTTPLLEGYTLLTLVDVTQQREAEAAMRENLRYTAELSDTAIAQALELKDLSETLERRIAQRTSQLQTSNRDAIWMLAVACEAKDHDTGEHVRRIQFYTEQLATHLGLPETQVLDFGISSLLHDVGKLKIPDSILTKPAPLTPEERLVMQDHTIHGHRIILESHFLHTARMIARCHHENWDGTGYPDKLKGEEIPLAARIVHLVDVYDALTSERVYKSIWTYDDVLREIHAQRAVMFDPALVDAFTQLVARGPLVPPPPPDMPAAVSPLADHTSRPEQRIAPRPPAPAALPRTAKTP